MEREILVGDRRSAQLRREMTEPCPVKLHSTYGKDITSYSTPYCVVVTWSIWWTSSDMIE